MSYATAVNAMLEELRVADPVFLPSGFWADLNDKNRKMLEAEGLSNFKRTVAQNYFSWLIVDIGTRTLRMRAEAVRRRC